MHILGAAKASLSKIAHSFNSARVLELCKTSSISRMAWRASQFGLVLMISQDLVRRKNFLSFRRRRILDLAFETLAVKRQTAVRPYNNAE